MNAMKIGEAIRAGRLAKGWTLERLAQEAGTDTGNLSRLERGKQQVNDQLLQRILALVDVSVMVQAPGQLTADHGPSSRDKVPLISWAQAASWHEIADIYAVSDAECWLPCPAPHGLRTFALRVRGPSMLNPAERHTFNDGDIIFVDPDQPEAHRSLVVAKLSGSQEATFRQLIIEADQRYLMALNPSWPDKFTRIDDGTVFCGVAIGKFESLL
ncbi:MAG TPA: hypothetical protein DCR72_14545 [Pseudomonas sp.]|nr:hypothetical protein [Pseudomonas sp.]